MPEEDLTPPGTRGPRHGRHPGDRPRARHRSSTAAERARSALRRLARARARQRRRWAVAVVTAPACLAALLAYVNWGSTPAPEEPPVAGSVPAGVGRPSAPPGAQPSAGPASPGLRPRQRPPSPSPTPTTSPPAPPPVLTLTRNDVPAEVDLTAVGTRDWVHWGLLGDGSTVRKRDGSGEIRDDGGSGRRGSWDGNQETFRWRDGAPVESTDGTPHGVFTCGAGRGFALAAAGSGQPRTLHVYAGTWMARGRLDARLSSGGPTRTLRMEDPHTSRSAEFVVRFQAPEGARLVVTWTAEHAFTDDCAGVSLQAAALR
ncbi:hypothetical protein [Micromonospora thermarum]|uniref:hypothetical protein n=1 Tax=Micromonospora thermarum TaxID=2720024 RepID=UPI00281679E1|nr:hypothetical protein [Micromonospora thermarum]